jgi:hypothetical protein
MEDRADRLRTQEPPLTTVNGVLDELRAAKVPVRAGSLQRTGHGFSAPKNKDGERANRESITTTTRTFKELFGT